MHRVVTLSVAADLKGLGLPMSEVSQPEFRARVEHFCEGYFHPLEAETGALPRLLASIGAVGADALILYSGDDALIAPPRVEEFRDALIEKLGSEKVRASRFAGPAHIRLFAEQPDRYAADLEELVVAKGLA